MCPLTLQLPGSLSPTQTPVMADSLHKADKKSNQIYFSQADANNSRAQTAASTQNH